MPTNGGTVHNGQVAATVDQAKSGPKGRRLTMMNIGMTLIVAAALGLIVLGFASATTGDKSTTINDPAVDRVQPAPGDLVLRQSEVGIYLAAGYRGILIIDGQEIPTFEITASDTGSATPFDKIVDARYDPGQHTVLFTPQVGSTVQAFSPGRHKVTAIFWRDRVEAREQGRAITWFFSVS